MQGVAALEIAEDGLAIAWAGSEPASRYPWLWLRDHGHEPATLHPVTLQRQLDTAAVPDDIRGTAARLADDGQTLEVVWSTGEAEPLPARLPVAVPDAARRGERACHAARPLGCRAASPDSCHGSRFAAVMAGDAGLERWLGAVETYGFCLVEGVPATPADSAALARRIGYLRETIFGSLWDFTADLAKADTAYTTLELRPHTDGTYALDAPGLQFFHCLEFSGTGGESVLVDGFRIADELREHDPEAYATLSGGRGHRPVHRRWRPPDGDPAGAFATTTAVSCRSPSTTTTARRSACPTPRCGRSTARCRRSSDSPAARGCSGSIRCARARCCCSTTGASCTAARRTRACKAAVRRLPQSRGFREPAASVAPAAMTPMGGIVVSEARSDDRARRGVRDPARRVRRRAGDQRGARVRRSRRRGPPPARPPRRPAGRQPAPALSGGRVGWRRSSGSRCAPPRAGTRSGMRCCRPRSGSRAQSGAGEARLHAQCTVQAFYRQRGFAAYGPTFMEDGILHVAMRVALAAGRLEAQAP